MSKKPTLALIAAGVATAVMWGTMSAHAITFKNCTGSPIRVHVYYDTDMVKALAAAGGKIGIDGKKTWNPDHPKSRMAIKVFEAGPIDALKLSQSALKGTHTYSIRRSSKGAWSVSEKNNCN